MKWSRQRSPTKSVEKKKQYNQASKHPEMMLKIGLEGETMTGFCGGLAKHSVGRGSPANLKNASGHISLPGKEANDG